ncbi:MAG: flagellar protein FlaG [Anaerolineae bacterium]|nr:flagellar protein FlaG [Anaerolineae bacterium]
MESPLNPHHHLSNLDSYTYPQFIIDEATGKIEVNFIDKESGRVLRHIPSTELNEIVKDYYLMFGIKADGTTKDQNGA